MKRFIKNIISVSLSLFLLFSLIPATSFVSANTYKVWLDAGHGGSDSGAVGSSDRYEKNDSLEITLAVGNILTSYGIEVGYTRTGDSTVNLYDRPPMAASFDADFLVSIHRNSASNPSATGLETYYHFRESEDSLAAQLANKLQRYVLDATGYVDRGVKLDGNPDDGDIGLCMTREPSKSGIAASLIELGFISNDNDNAALDNNKQAVIEGIARAIVEMCGMQYVGPQRVPVEAYVKNDELYLADCNSLIGWRTAFNTDLTLGKSDDADDNNVVLNANDWTADNSVSVGAMAFYEYTSGHSANISDYDTISFDLYSSIDYSTSGRNGDYFQINFFTSGEDGYNIAIPAGQIHQGWNTYVYKKSEIAAVVTGANWSSIAGIRFTWFNVSHGDNITFAVDNVKAYNEITEVTPILGPVTAAVSTAKEWARRNNATETFISLADTYWDLAPKVGINPVVAYCQFGLESGYGKFGGVLDESYCNPCGLKVPEGGDDYDAGAHKRFPNWETGIQAHLDHLALYAKAPGYPKADSPDPRHFQWIWNSGSNQIEVANGYNGLSGWATTGNSYCEHLVSMIKTLESLNPTSSSVDAPDTVILNEDGSFSFTLSFKGCASSSTWFGIYPANQTSFDSSSSFGVWGYFYNGLQSGISDSIGIPADGTVEIKSSNILSNNYGDNGIFSVGSSYKIVMFYNDSDREYDVLSTDTFEMIEDPSEKPIYGDADGDREVLALDALLVLQHSVGKITIDEKYVKYCDVNFDGSVTTTDALLILQKSVNLISDFKK